MNVVMVFMLTLISLICCYPLLVFIKLWFVKRIPEKSNTFIKPVSIIIAAYNEEKHIEQKIISLLDKNEWIEGSEIIINTAGSTDNTNRILEKINRPDVLRIVLKGNQTSKIDAVNHAVSISKHELLIFSDCRQKMKKNSIKNLVHYFNDSTVGTVVATLIDNSVNPRGSFFRNIINRININESISGSCLNVYGALYAQRKSCYRLIPTDILFDDLFVVVSTLQQKMRLIQVRDAVIYDMDFNSYYRKERAQRLARGLWLFLLNHYTMINKLSLWDKTRFLLYKYGKLIFPFVFLIILPFAFLYFFRNINYFQPRIIITISVLVTSIFVFIKPFRKTAIILWYFFTSSINFFFLNMKSIEWEKLD